jgi:hypothetical protein
MRINFVDLESAFEFVSGASTGEKIAYLDRESGQFYFESAYTGDIEEPLPEDLDDDKYIEIPHKNELDLGKPLALAFARDVLPGDYDEVRDIFSRKGAYRRFRDFLVRRGALDRWYKFFR